MHYFGIDLGTTNSCIAAYDEDSGLVSIIPAVGARNTTPSVVYLPDGDAPEVVGDTAINQLKVEPKRVITYTKRLIA
ncbi:MAG: Hsp70 family protein, partial [Lentisphaeria bacterium]|nr:Hsp70 family protein [Lentisphaeria bacterium]